MTCGEVTKQRLNAEIGEEPIVYRGIPRLFVCIRLVSTGDRNHIYIYIRIPVIHSHKNQKVLLPPFYSVLWGYLDVPLV